MAEGGMSKGTEILLKQVVKMIGIDPVALMARVDEFLSVVRNFAHEAKAMQEQNARIEAKLDQLLAAQINDGK